MKRLTDLRPYEGVLPYSSEIFGVYQPMLGWRSKKQRERMERGFATDIARAREALVEKLHPHLEVHLTERGQFAEVASLAPATLEHGRHRGTDTFLGEAIARELPPIADYRPEVWDVIDPDRLAAVLNDEVVPAVLEWQSTAMKSGGGGDDPTGVKAANHLARESTFAGYLLHLKEVGDHEALKQIFYSSDAQVELLLALMRLRDPLEHLDPHNDIGRLTLSPLGIVHLFRQYFFEFDTFLGPPVGHVWLSPGSTVELVEVTTRRTYVEKTLEQQLESIVKSEQATTDQDELADAIKEENRSDTKFGMTATVNQGWIGGSATATTSLNLENTQSTAREHSHKRMRQQSEKLSTEIRRNVTSTFRTVSEVTDVSSKRHVLTNTSGELVNYELRRKMRQVGVQVHDIGTHLCWQTYVDDPGRQLGIGKLVHLAKSPETGAIPPPESIPMPGDRTTSHNVDIPFVPATEDTEPEDMDEAYRNGVEVNTDFNEGDPEAIQWVFTGQTASCDQPNHEFSSLKFDYGGNDVQLEAFDIVETSPGAISYGIKVRHINFQNNPTVRVVAQVTWRPSAEIRAEIDKKNAENVAAFNEATKREFERAFVDAARERIEKASEVRPRPFDDLREEERIVVYRALVQDLLTKGVPLTDDRTRHVVAELLNTIFDIDKMLYFVAPEWWRPRLHHSHQVLGAAAPPPKAGVAGAESKPSGWKGKAVSVLKDAKSAKGKAIFNAITAMKNKAVNTEDHTIPSDSVVAWGGTDENRADNYYITEKSEPAKLGSSLGWLLQLDGDNLRNAFLNAPWVKAVIPIRPGRERAAMNWLKGVGVEGSEGLDADYVPPAAELAEIPHAGPVPTVEDAINHLCDVVAAKHAEGIAVGRYPKDEINDDNRVSATPIDKVYEHGFYPLQGGFRAAQGDDSYEVFDQWVEVLPTDQVVPVEVEYDPKTGRQI